MSAQARTGVLAELLTVSIKMGDDLQQIHEPVTRLLSWMFIQARETRGYEWDELVRHMTTGRLAMLVSIYTTRVLGFMADQVVGSKADLRACLCCEDGGIGRMWLLLLSCVTSFSAVQMTPGLLDAIQESARILYALDARRPVSTDRSRILRPFPAALLSTLYMHNDRLPPKKPWSARLVLQLSLDTFMCCISTGERESGGGTNHLSLLIISSVRQA